MSTKICTSIDQSKKLIDLGIDVNTADMFWDMTEPDERRKPYTGPISDYYDMENWAVHFDYRGLIEKGLAIEAPEEMYK